MDFYNYIHSDTEQTLDVIEAHFKTSLACFADSF